MLPDMSDEELLNTDIDKLVEGANKVTNISDETEPKEEEDSFVKSNEEGSSEESSEDAGPEDSAEATEAPESVESGPEGESTDEPFDGAGEPATSVEGPSDPEGDTPSGQADADSDNVDGEEAKDASNQNNYEEFYKKVMAPFKANGKTITLDSAEEVIQLMQKGANYTRKMQELAQYRKAIMLLKDSELLEDTGQLSFLLDLHKKDPEAIKKLLKDANFDIYDYNAEEDPKYVPKAPISDEEVAFRSAIEDLQAQEGGSATIQEINSTWDEKSKEVLWHDPKVFEVIHQQRQQGIYQKIVDEMEILRIKGQLPPGTFIEQYRAVGLHLRSKGAFDGMVDSASRQQPSPPTPAAVRKRVAAPKPSNLNKVRAAGAPRQTKKASSLTVEDLSDEDFLKKFKDLV